MMGRNAVVVTLSTWAKIMPTMQWCMCGQKASINDWTWWANALANGGQQSLDNCYEWWNKMLPNGGHEGPALLYGWLGNLILEEKCPRATNVSEISMWPKMLLELENVARHSAEMWKVTWNVTEIWIGARNANFIAENVAEKSESMLETQAPSLKAPLKFKLLLEKQVLPLKTLLKSKLLPKAQLLLLKMLLKSELLPRMQVVSLKTPRKSEILLEMQVPSLETLLRFEMSPEMQLRMVVTCLLWSHQSWSSKLFAPCPCSNTNLTGAKV